ncbi:MAG: fibronectin type III domain-containing protein, partial [Clostridia bacterium]|nr:fibronectin type III domain-containing protein [Clostridia bacterium]
MAIGDKTSYVDSNAGLFQRRPPLNDYELAAFNDYNYCLDIVTGSPKNTNILAVPEFVPNCEGSHGGALKLSLVSGTYGWTIFRLNLQRSFNVGDIGENGGIEIRFKLDSNQYTSTTLFQMLRPYDAEYCASIRVTPETNNEWMVLRATMTGKLPSSYTEEEDFSHLQLNVYNLVRAGGKGDLYLDYIKIYNDVVETPSNLTLDNNVLTWDSIADASSYNIEVSILNEDNLETQIFVSNTNSIDLSELSDKQYNARVQANSAEISKASSNWSEYISKRQAPAGNTIADFNNPLYINDINGTTTILDKNGKILFQSHLKNKTFLEEGAIKIELSNDWRLSNFNVKLLKPLDLEKDGIEIKFKVESSTYDSDNPMIFRLVSESNKNDYDFIETNCVSVNIGEWETLKLSSEQLAKVYQTGDNVLYFSFITKNGSNGKSVVALLDDISYYEQLDVPANITLTDKTLMWDAVEGATGYNVEVDYYDGNEVKTTVIPTTETTIDLSAYTEFNVKVQATSNTVYDSEWSTSLGIRNLSPETLANFNNSLYELDIQTSHITHHDKSVVKSVTYQDGAVEVKVSSSYRNNNFKIVLSKGIDLSRYGIEIRFKVTDSGYGDEERIYFKLTDGNATHNYGADSMLYYQTIKVNEWQILKLSSSDLDAYYNDGDKVLFFTIVSATGVTGSVATILLDDISYYEQLDVPTNVMLTDKTLTWDTVEGATGYNVEVSYYDGNEVKTIVIPTTETAIDLSAYTEFNVKVQATSNTVYDSEWSISKGVRNVENPIIADFNNALYVEDILSSNINGYQTSLVKSAKYVDGAVEIQVGNNGWKHANFKIDLKNTQC